MAGINDLIATFMGQTNTAMNAAPSSWQQELLETVNPEKVKRQNIARALAKASTVLATTPGNFLDGLSAAAATGADAYLTGRDQADQDRMKVQQLLGMQAQKDQDRRLSLLLDAIGVQRNLTQDKERAEDRVENRNIRREESAARKAYWDRRGTGGEEDGYNANQTRLIRDSMRKALDEKRKTLLDPDGDPYTPDGLTGADMEAALSKEQARLEAIYDLPLYAKPRQPQVQAPYEGKSDMIVPKNVPATGPAKVSTKAEYDALPSGALYIAPDGSQRRKP